MSGEYDVEPVEVEILFGDLTEEIQKSIADIMGCGVGEVEGHTNWDCMPLATAFVHPLTEDEKNE